MPVNISLERSKLKNEPYPDSSNVLKDRLKLYDEYILTKKNKIKIDCCEELSIVSNKIIRELKD